MPMQGEVKMPREPGTTRGKSRQETGWRWDFVTESRGDSTGGINGRCQLLEDQEGEVTLGVGAGREAVRTMHS